MVGYTFSTLSISANAMLVALQHHWGISKRASAVLRIVSRDREVGPDTPESMALLKKTSADLRYVPKFTVARSTMYLNGWEGLHFRYMEDHGYTSQSQTLTHMIARAYVHAGLHTDNSHA